MKKVVCKKCGSDDVRITEDLNPNDDTTIRQYFTNAYQDDGGQCFCDTCLDYQEFEVIDVPDEELDPWRCEVCGSLDVQQQAWVDPSTDQVVSYNACDRGDFWCEHCEEHEHIVRESELMKDIEEWWLQSEGETKEVITGVEYDDFHIGDSDDELQEADGRFTEACNEKWNALSVEDKIHIWHELTRDKSNDS